MKKPRSLIFGTLFVLTVLYLVSWYLMERDPVVIAMRLQAEGNYERAIEVLNGTIEADPNRGDAYGCRGYCRLQRLDVAGGMEDLEACVRLLPNKPEAYVYRAHGLLMQEKYDAALEDCERALALDGRNAAAYSTRASVWAHKGDFPRALADAEKAFEQTSVLYPKVMLHVQRAIVKRVLRDYGGAVEDCDAAIQRNSRLPAAYLQRGLAWHLRGEADRAQADFRKYLDLRPGRDVYLRRQIALAEKGRVPTMREDTALALESERTARADAPKQEDAGKPAQERAEQPVAANGGAPDQPAPQQNFFTRPLPLYATLVAGIVILFIFTGLWKVQQNALELLRTTSLPRDLKGVLVTLAGKAQVRRLLALVTAIGLFVAWYFEKRLPLFGAVILGLFFLDSLGVAGRGRALIQSIQGGMRTPGPKALSQNHSSLDQLTDHGRNA